MKIAFGLMLTTYTVIIAVWGYRFPISYQLTNGTYKELVLDHNFSMQERNGIERAYHIRQTISGVLTWSSVLLSIAAYVYQRTLFSRRKAFVRGIMYIAGFIAIFLLLIDGIHFIPGPPIR